MLNQTGIVTKQYGVRKTILIDERNSTALSCKVENTGVTADDEGRKIVKAGTPAYGSLTDRDTPFTVSGSGDPVGVILHDVDVTAGTANSQVVIFGTIDVSKVDEDVAAKLEAATFKMIQIAK